MWESVQLALQVVLCILGMLLLLRRDVLNYFSRRRGMKKSWEDVLGQRVIIVQRADGRWTWEAMDLDVQADPNVTFPSDSACRLACAAMVYAFFVMEEVTSILAPPSTNTGQTNRRPASPD
jgi:hypothetical protein